MQDRQLGFSRGISWQLPSVSLQDASYVQWCPVSSVALQDVCLLQIETKQNKACKTCLKQADWSSLHKFNIAGCRGVFRECLNTSFQRNLLLEVIFYDMYFARVFIMCASHLNDVYQQKLAGYNLPKIYLLFEQWLARFLFNLWERPSQAMVIHPHIYWWLSCNKILSKCSFVIFIGLFHF